MPIKLWDIKQPDEPLAASLAAELKIPRLVARVLAARGWDTAEKASGFLSCDHCLTDPLRLKDMDLAAASIRKALENGKKIVIYGDYDCDGIMSTVLLYSYLESVGGDVCYYIPQRDREGYGLNKDAIRLIHDSGAELLITVDNGITAIEEVDYANSLGLEVVITDHHKPREILPTAAAVVDPHRLDDESGCEYLAGVGVAFKLVCALEGEDGDFLLDQYGDLVAVATIADIVPLRGENRLIVKRGLELLREPQNEGIAALLEACGLAGKPVACENIAYGLVPRINSAGRFDQVDSAVELFVGGGDPQELAEAINTLNSRRRELEDTVVHEILDELGKREHLQQDRIIIIDGENWYHGVVGIVASRMTERFGKPCIVLSHEGEFCRGSARSIEGFSIIDAINACSKWLVRYGGHNQAAGLTLETRNLQAFSEAINAWAYAHHPEMPVQTLHIDCILSPKELEVGRIRPVSMLEPFGSGNEAPVFMISGCVIQGIYSIGDGKHLRLRLYGNDTVFFAVYFGMTQENFPYMVGEVVDIAFSADVGEWNGEPRLSVKLRDIHLTGVDYRELHHSDQVYQRLLRHESEGIDAKYALPDRNDIAAVYRYLRARGDCAEPDEVLYAHLHGRPDSFCKLKVALDVLEEMHLITHMQINGRKVRRVVKNPARVNIADSRILKALSKCAAG